MTQHPSTPPTGAPGGAPHANPFDRLMIWLRECGVTRDDQEKWAAGVAAGIAHRLGVDPIVVRAALIALSIFGGIGVTLYLGAWALLPTRSGDIVLERAVKDHDAGAILILIGFVATFFGGPAASGDRPWFGFGWVIPVALIGWWVYHRRTEGRPAMPHHSGHLGTSNITSGPAPYTPGHVGTEADQGSTAAAPFGNPSERDYAAEATARAAAARATADARREARLALQAQRRADRRPGLTFPLFLVAAGFVGAAYGVGQLMPGLFGDALTAAQASALCAVSALGIFLIALGAFGRRAGILVLAAIVLVIHASGALWGNAEPWRGGIGDQTWKPAATATSATYRLGVGDSTLDLRDLSTSPTSPVQLTVSQGVGNVTVQIPAALDVKVVTEVGVGDVSIDGEQARDLRRGQSYDWSSSSATPDAIVNVDLSVGSVHIEKVN